MTVKDIANLIPTASALALTAKNLELAKKKNKSSNDFLEMGATNLVGVSLIKAQADIAGSL